MAFNKWGYKFDGPYASPDPLQQIEGVYVIWCKDGDLATVLDVGETDNVRDRLKDHERADRWRRYCEGTIYYSVTYTPDLDEDGRRAIEQHIRDVTNPPCS